MIVDTARLAMFYHLPAIDSSKQLLRLGIDQPFRQQMLTQMRQQFLYPLPIKRRIQKDQIILLAVLLKKLQGVQVQDPRIFGLEQGRIFDQCAMYGLIVFHQRD